MLSIAQAPILSAQAPIGAYVYEYRGKIVVKKEVTLRLEEEAWERLHRAAFEGKTSKQAILEKGLDLIIGNPPSQIIEAKHSDFASAIQAPDITRLSEAILSKNPDAVLSVLGYTGSASDKHRWGTVFRRILDSGHPVAIGAILTNVIAFAMLAGIEGALHVVNSVTVKEPREDPLTPEQRKTVAGVQAAISESKATIRSNRRMRRKPA